MPVIQKIMLSYVTFFGGAIMILTVCGYWKETENFLDNNTGFGIFVSLLYFVFAYIYYDSIEKVAKNEFDKRRITGKDGKYSE